MPSGKIGVWAVTIPQTFQSAVQHHQAGRLADAEALYRQILAVQPNHADALHLLGLVAHQVGRDDIAADLIRQSIVFGPNNPVAHFNLSAACRALERFDEAMSACRRALELKPDYPEALLGFGNALRDRGQFDEAIAAYRRALELKPDYPEAHINLGTALTAQGRLDEAVAAYRDALALRPGLPEAYNNLGAALKDRGQYDEAVDACRRALEIKPDYAAAHNNLGNALREQGELDGALAAYRRAIEIKPDHAGAHGNLIYTLHFLPGQDAGTIGGEQSRWNRQFSDPLKPLIAPRFNSPAVAGRLRIGYVSPDFRDHAVGRFALPLLERHDRERFEFLCYSGVLQPDWMTERFRALAGGWRNTIGVSDVRLAEIIREDGVDILVDLALHTGGNRLPVFARQPAPVQVSWLGYPGSAGLPSIRYRLTDAQMDPMEEGPPSAAEEPVRLPDCWCCYNPVGESPEINALPACSANGVTFGSLNNFAKVNESVLALWSSVLEAVKGSRLIMFCPEGRTRERALALFGARGITAQRVDLVGYLPRLEYLRLYQRIDIGLDPFPCNGMTTTCDAFWMGVPVVTAPGALPVSRAGLSILTSIGLEAFAASSEADYLRVAMELAADLPRLEALRSTLRSRMLASPLMDAPRFARNVEAAYRKMWERWCSGQSPLLE